MNRTIEHLKSLIDEFESVEVIGDYHYGRAPKTATTPYITFSVDDIIDTTPTLNSTIVFSIYDSENKSSTTIREIADKIIEYFNHKQFVKDDHALHFVLTIMQDIKQEYLQDKQCIELQFDATIYTKGND